VEAVARTHPAVREAVVVDLPDRFSGAVAAAFVSLHPGSSADGASVRAHVNERVPYYQQLRHVSVTPQIPRSLTGKIERRELRYALIAHHRQGDPMSAEIPQRALQAGLTIVNTFTLKDPGLARTFEQGFLDHVEFMRAQPGFVAHQMIHRTDDPRVYVNVGWWERPDDFQAVRTSPTFVEHAAQFHRWVDVEALPARSLPVARGADLIGTQTDGGMLVLETLIPGGNADRLTAAFAAYVAAAPDADLHWVDLSFGLRESGRYTAISRWSDTAGWERARAMPEYQAVLDLAQVTAAPATSLAASRAVPAGV
jgi:long-chain acyl-CoA synthetase